MMRKTHIPVYFPTEGLSLETSMSSVAQRESAKESETNNTEKLSGDSPKSDGDGEPSLPIDKEEKAAERSSSSSQKEEEKMKVDSTSKKEASRVEQNGVAKGEGESHSSLSSENGEELSLEKSEKKRQELREDDDDEEEKRKESDKASGSSRSSPKDKVGEVLVGDDVFEDESESEMAREPSERLERRPSTMFLAEEHNHSYKLVATANHYGAMGGGHYIAYALNEETKTWYCFDDNVVEPADVKSISPESVYLMFYVR